MKLFNKKQSEDILNKIAEAYFEDALGVLILDKDESVYKVEKSDDFLAEAISDDGSLRNLARALFGMNMAEENGSISAYNTFSMEEIFNRDKYVGITTLSKGEKRQTYGVSMLKLDDRYNVVMLQDVSALMKYSEIETEKVMRISENYLFSMVVDLNTDLCHTPRTTELNSNMHDDAGIKYSDWRMKISNMFMEDDKRIFLQKSTPDYVRHILGVLPKYEFEAKMLNMSGVYIWVRLSFIRMHDYSDDNPRFLYTVSDISEEMDRLLKQQSLIDDIKNKNELLSLKMDSEEKLARLAHDIKTPLNSIVGMSEIIIREANNESIVECAEDIQSAGNYLRGLVEGVLNTYKSDDVLNEVSPVSYNIRKVALDVYNIFKLPARNKGLKYELDIDDNVPGVLFGDAIKVSQVIANLISNAIKYTKNGSVNVAISGLSNEKSPEYALKLVVSDTGIGMTEGQTAQIYDMFTRFAGPENEEEGYGIGMNIVSRIIDSLGASIDISSQPGAGSSISVVIPQTISNLAAGEYKNQCSVDISGISASILVVDDFPSNVRVVEGLLQKYQDIKVDAAYSGKEALSMLQNKKYDLVLLDQRMPDMKGEEVLITIIGEDEYYESVPIIAMTGDAGAINSELFKSKGFTEMLSKPIYADELFRVIERNIK